MKHQVWGAVRAAGPRALAQRPQPDRQRLCSAAAAAPADPHAGRSVQKPEASPQRCRRHGWQLGPPSWPVLLSCGAQSRVLFQGPHAVTSLLRLADGMPELSALRLPPRPLSALISWPGDGNCSAAGGTAHLLAGQGDMPPKKCCKRQAGRTPDVQAAHQPPCSHFQSRSSPTPAAPPATHRTAPGCRRPWAWGRASWGRPPVEGGKCGQGQEVMFWCSKLPATLLHQLQLGVARKGCSTMPRFPTTAGCHGSSWPCPAKDKQQSKPLPPHPLLVVLVLLLNQADQRLAAPRQLLHKGAGQVG